MTTAYASGPIIEPAAGLDLSRPYEISKDSSLSVQRIEVYGSTEKPSRLNLGTLFDSRFRVFAPIPVEFERTEQNVAAVWPEIDEFGYAESASAACVELGKSIAQLYLTLEAELSNLGPDLNRVWSILNQHVEPFKR